MHAYGWLAIMSSLLLYAFVVLAFCCSCNLRPLLFSIHGLLLASPPVPHAGDHLICQLLLCFFLGGSHII
jgi:hypothetical protein